HGVDLGLVDELDDIDEAGALGRRVGELFVREDNIAVLLELIAADDVLPGDFLTVGLGDALVADRRMVVLAQLLELRRLRLGGRVHAHRDRDQAEVDRALPDGSRCHDSESMPTLRHSYSHRSTLVSGRWEIRKP